MKKNIAKTYWDIFALEIRPRLQAIDIFLKTEIPPYDTCKAAKLLDIDEEDIKKYLLENKETLDKTTFLILMKQGNSELCRMFRRELSRGTPKTYEPYDISYIYNIDMDLVLDACGKLGIRQIPQGRIHEILQLIPVPIE
ncbi:MAG: hypothetical protein KHZ62_04335 [Clostridiales bacterium]|nr:hypothetical protein [Clostridiales bacterium]